MLKKLGHIAVFMSLITLLLLNGTAHEFLHQFSGHIDTPDCQHSKHDSQKSFEQAHVHCDFLDFSFSPFDFDFQLFFTPSISEYTQFISILNTDIHYAERPYTALRGPPLLY